jgi:hypothetical protein
VNSTTDVPILHDCTFINNVAISNGYGNDICINSSTSIGYLSASNYLNNVCSTSDLPRMSGNSSDLTGNIESCSDENDDYLKNCKIIHLCGDFNEDINECNSRTKINTKDGPCIYLLSVSESRKGNESGSCISKSDINNKCNEYSNSTECEADDSVGGIGCKWDDNKCDKES